MLFPLANSLVFNKVRAALGLDRCHMCASGAAPISRQTLEFFLSLNIPIMEVYGMSESSGMLSISIYNYVFMKINDIMLNTRFQDELSACL